VKKGVFVVACMMHASVAAAADKVDTSDGRIDGDLAVALGAGATFGPRSPRPAVDLRLRYLWTVGAFVTYEDGPLVGASAEPRRVLATGLELRPLFLARWFNGLEWGKPYADLTLDSLGLELGALFVQPEGGSFGAHPGLQAGIGFEVPIFPRATGPLVGFHGGVRWSGDALSAHPLQGPADRALYLAITLAWQQVFGSHIVDAGDRAP
jgi:hypothetical protein